MTYRDLIWVLWVLVTAAGFLAFVWEIFEYYWYQRSPKPPVTPENRRKVMLIRATRYSALFARILENYGDRAMIRIDSKTYSGSAARSLPTRTWTNKGIKRRHRFSLAVDGLVLFQFQFGPENLVAEVSELKFVNDLKNQKLLRYTIVSEYKPRRPRTLLAFIVAVIMEASILAIFLLMLLIVYALGLL